MERNWGVPPPPTLAIFCHSVTAERARVVAGAGGKLDSDAVRLALEFARIGQAHRHVRHDAREARADVSESQQRRAHADDRLLGHLLRRALAAVLPQRMADLVTHDRCKLCRWLAASR